MANERIEKLTIISVLDELKVKYLKEDSQNDWLIDLLQLEALKEKTIKRLPTSYKFHSEHSGGRM